MTSKREEKITTIIMQQRDSIPVHNLTCYDATCSGFMEMMIVAGDDTYKKLASRFWKVIKDMKRYNYSNSLPPLPRIVGEDATAYCKRLYRCSGFTNA